MGLVGVFSPRMVYSHPRLATWEASARSVVGILRLPLAKELVGIGIHASWSCWDEDGIGT